MKKTCTHRHMRDAARLPICAFTIVLAFALTGLQSLTIPVSAEGVQPDGGMNRVPYLMKAVLNHPRFQFAAPAVGDLDHDKYREIVAGTVDGHIVAVKANSATGTILWDFDAAAAINASARTPSGVTVRAAAAIADLDQDGWNEVIVPVGDVTSSRQNGGVIVLTHDGKLMPGWPQLTFDKYDEAFTEGIGVPPSVADLDADGDLEILVGAWDSRIYAWHHDGSWVKGWPQHVFDTVWSSPSVGDLDRDGLLEVVVGVDAHTNPYFHSVDGGALYVFRADGSPYPGFPIYMPENFESHAALADLDGDGYLDIVIGGGAYYDHGPVGYRVHAVNRFAQPLAGWPVSTGGHVTGAPAIVDVNRDGRLDVVVGSWDEKLYAWSGNGQALPGFPLTPRVWSGASYRVYSPIAADTNADGKPEIYVNYGWEVTAVDALGRQMTWDGTKDNPGNRPSYYTGWTIDAAPTIDDINGDGQFELVVAGAEGGSADGGRAIIYAWALPSSRTSVTQFDWPAIKRDGARSGLRPCPDSDDAVVARRTLPSQMAPGGTARVQLTFRNTGPSTWTSGAGYQLAADRDFYGADFIPLPSGASVGPGQEVTFAFDITAPSQKGMFEARWRMAKGNGQQFGRSVALTVKVGSEPLLYALRAAPGGGVFSSDARYQIPAPNPNVLWERTRGFRLTTDQRGYYLLDREAHFMWAGSAHDIGSVGTSPAVEIVQGPDKESVLVMDQYGRLSITSAAMPIEPAPPTFGDPRVRSFALTPDYNGILTLDGRGNVYPSGTASALSPATPVFDQDIALRIKLRRDGKGYYVLDKYGRVHAGGNAPALKANYNLHMNEDWARDFELTENEKGYYLLDKYGGVWTGGQAPPPGAIPWAGTWSDGSAMDLEVANSTGAAGLQLSVMGSSLSMLGGLNRTPVPVSVKIASGDGSSVSWTAKANDDWVKLSATSGTTPSTLVLSLARQLPVGSYSSSLRIEAKNSSGTVIDAQNLAISLKVVKTLTRAHLPVVMNR